MLEKEEGQSLAARVSIISKDDVSSVCRHDDRLSS